MKRFTRHSFVLQGHSCSMMKWFTLTAKILLLIADARFRASPISLGRILRAIYLINQRLISRQKCVLCRGNGHLHRMLSARSCSGTACPASYYTTRLSWLFLSPARCGNVFTDGALTFSMAQCGRNSRWHQLKWFAVTAAVNLRL